MEKIKKYLPSIPAVLSAIGFSLASPVWNQEWLVFLSLIPVFYLLDKKSYWSLAKDGYWIQIIFCFGVFFWVPQSFSNLWENSWWFNIVLFLTICSLVEFQFPLFMPLAKLIKEKLPYWTHPFLMAGAYTILDAIYPKFFRDTLSNAFWEQTNFMSHFDFPWGSYGATFVIVLVNWVLYELWKRKPWTSVIVYALCLSVVYFTPQKVKPYSKSLTVYTVNTDFTFKAKKERGYNQQTFSLILKSLESIPEGSVVIFPETLYPYDFLNPSEIRDQQQNDIFKKKIQERKQKVFMGNVSTMENKKINVILLIRENGQVEFGTKQKLFPFGEYIPFQWIPGFASLFPPTMVDPSPRGQNVFEVDGVKFGSAICYESIFTDHLRDLKAEGAEVALNISNETWFGYFGEPQLSFAMSVFSSIENDMPLVRSTNGGTAGLVQGGVIEDLFLNRDQITIKSYELKIP